MGRLPPPPTDDREPVMAEILSSGCVSAMAARALNSADGGSAADLARLAASHEALRAALDRLLAVARRVADGPVAGGHGRDVGQAVGAAEADLCRALDEADGLRVGLARLRPRDAVVPGPLAAVGRAITPAAAHSLAE